MFTHIHHPPAQTRHWYAEHSDWDAAMNKLLSEQSIFEPLQGAPHPMQFPRRASKATFRHVQPRQEDYPMYTFHNDPLETTTKEPLDPGLLDIKNIKHSVCVHPYNVYEAESYYSSANVVACERGPDILAYAQYKHHHEHEYEHEQDSRRVSSTSSDTLTTSSGATCRRFSSASTASSKSSAPSCSTPRTSISKTKVTPPAQTPSSSHSSHSSGSHSSSIDVSSTGLPITSKKEDKEVTFMEVEQVQKVPHQQHQNLQQHPQMVLQSHARSQAGATSTTPSPVVFDVAVEPSMPVWADPKRVRENPTRYAFLKSYLEQHNIPFSSVLPLPTPCTFYFSDTRQAKAASNYIAAVKPLFDCHSVWDFSAQWRTFKERKGKPSHWPANQNVYCFVDGVEPMWEDKVNKDGGRLTLSPPKSALDDVFEWALCSFVGGNLAEFGLVGIVLSRRVRSDRIELWLDSSATPATIPRLREKMGEMMPESTKNTIQSAHFKKHFDK
ncbi:translation initiation factor eIF 4e-like domain-containing protein [Phycomyces nitens]|nr:translation initiation factor eIF 4e-like domain-containing protein [Phycomyces nitens]